MSVCVAMNLSDGVVMAVDSATTIFSGPGAISKVFLDGDKLFQLGDLRVGIATYGLAAMSGRTIGSFVREFIADPTNFDLESLTLKEIAERLRKFLFAAYQSFFEKIHSKPFDEIPSNMKGILGLVIGGFSPGSYQSEIWVVVIPAHSTPYSALQKNAPGNFGFSWYAASMPINRYLKGIDPEVSVKIRSHFEAILGRPLDEAELAKFQAILDEHEYHIKFDGMPIQSGDSVCKISCRFCHWPLRVC
jgi:hypothetical protein